MHDYNNIDFSQLTVPDSYQGIVEISNIFSSSGLSGNVVPIYITFILFFLLSITTIILTIKEDQAGKENNLLVDKILQHSSMFITTYAVFWTMIISMVLNILYYIGLEFGVLDIEYYIPLVLSIHPIIFGYLEILIIALFSTSPLRSIIMYTITFMVQLLSVIMMSAYQISIITRYQKEIIFQGLVEMLAVNVIISVFLAILVGIIFRIIGITLTEKA